MDPFEKMNKMQVDPEDRLEMTHEMFLRMLPKEIDEKTDLSPLVRLAATKTNEFINQYVEEFT